MKLRLIALLFLLSLVCLQTQAITFQEAKSLAVSRDYEKALVAFRSLIRQPRYANNAECNKFYGQCLCMTGHYLESLKYLEIGAKGRVTGAWWYLGISRQHLYDFDGAIDALEKYKSLCSANSTWIPRSDSIIAECKIGKRGVGHVQDVVIIDSIMVPKKDFFAHYKLGHESGHLISHKECGETAVLHSDSASAVFENLAKDFRLMALPSEETGKPALYSSSKFEGKWTTPERIESLGVDSRMAYPFQRTDGETLYFACDSTPGFGGLDIYVTRFNSETDSYYAPTRLGMPFNSPFNDYLFAVDETNQVGWWATERNAQPEFVCIYLFLFDEEADYLSGTHISRARIDRIADTWKEDNYEELLKLIHSDSAHAISTETLFIPIREGLVYHSRYDFKNAAAREAYDKYQSMVENITETTADLKSLREDYASGNEELKKKLKPQILQKEANLRGLYRQSKELEKEYRNLE